MERVSLCIIVLLIPILSSALNPNDVYHNNNSIFYVNPAFNEVKIRIKQSDITDIVLVVDTMQVPMSSIFKEETYEYYTATVTDLQLGLSYYFIVKAGLDSFRIPSTGAYTVATPQFIPPAWAQGKIYYSIFPDGFCNGDSTNDPDKTRKWGDPPHKWDPYGGDIVGIRNKVDYIDSLDPDIILLQSVFRSESNHKLNPRDYANVDPHLGDTINLKNLISEIHRRDMKIVLSVPFSHTGNEFPTFEDIEKNGPESKYLNWYTINSTPIKKSPPSYECWNGDYRFPKLNLSNPQVVNYLLGYLEYWKHFGFDGFYIGEDSLLDPVFIQTLRMNLKPRYPDILLIGSDKRLVSGSGLDGCCNRKVTALIRAYFIDRSIATSEFDHAIRKVLFYNPPQVNSVNLIQLYDHTARRFSSNPNTMKNLYAFIFTWVGSPVLLYGDEIGMTSSAPLNPGSFPWDVSQQDRSLLKEIKQLITLRRENPALMSTTFYSLYVNDINQVYAYDRGGIIVVINSSDKESYVELPAWSGVYSDMQTGEKKTAYNQKLRLSIGPQTYQLLKREF